MWMWATKQPRQTRDEVLRGLDVTTKRVNLWSGCRWIPELRLPLGHDAYNFARIARDLPARSSSCERGPAAHLSNGQYRVCAAAARRRDCRRMHSAFSCPPRGCPPGLPRRRATVHLWRRVKRCHERHSTARAILYKIRIASLLANPMA